MGVERRKKEDNTGKASKNISWTDAVEQKFSESEKNGAKGEVEQADIQVTEQTFQLAKKLQPVIRKQESEGKDTEPTK